MRNVFTLLVFLLPLLAYAQRYQHPQLKQRAVSINDFVPKGWVLKDSTSGDLNKDSLKDVAFVIQKRDSVTVQDEQGYDVKILPRIVAIAFRSPDDQFLLKEYNEHLLVTSSLPPTYADPFRTITIDRGMLDVEFFYDYVNGNICYYRYRFRFQQNTFKLIGAEKKYITRRNMNYTNRSYNFLTGKYSLTTGEYDNSINPPRLKEHIEWFQLKQNSLKTLKGITQPGNWPVTKDEML